MGGSSITKLQWIDYEWLIMPAIELSLTNVRPISILVETAWNEPVKSIFPQQR